MITLSESHRQFDSHVRIEKALNTVLTTTDTILKSANTVLPTNNTILTTTNTILTTTNTILTTTDTALTTTQTLLTVAETGALLPYFGDDDECSLLYLEETLKDLKPVSSARWSSRASPDGCLKDTREDVLGTMFSWLAEPSPSSSSMAIFWLAGLAGTGKSAIIKTFCQRISNYENFLLASFFASRNSAERRDPYRIVHTFAHQLAISSDRIRPHVLSALRAPQDVTQEPMHEQIKQLLAKPIEKAQIQGRTLVFVIDALDECQKSACGVEGGPLIELLAQILQHQPVKLLVTSRQEDSIAIMFRSLSHVPLRLHEIASAIVEVDVRRIFDAGFADIRQRRARDIGTDLWSSKSQLNTLVHRSGPFLIYAATVLKFLDSPRFSPRGRLLQILEHGCEIATNTSSPYSKIDALYEDVLKSATEEAPDCTSAELYGRVAKLIRTIVLLEEPVSVLALAHLMGVLHFENIQQIDNDVRALGSVILISHTSESERFSEIVSTFHPSFRDFLVSPQRCTNQHFLVTPTEHQHELLCRCLQLLNKHLRHDICNIRSPCLANAEIPNLAGLLARSVPEDVRYACRFWQVHLIASGHLTESVSVALHELCTDHLLHWLEVLSLLGELSFAYNFLPRCIMWYRVSNSPARQLNQSCLMMCADRVI
jgi:hypothetical protein